MADYFTEENKTVNYIYDFSDYWQHIIEFEEIKPAKKEMDYPICVEGERACPPEDCSGIPGYQRILEILNNPDDEEYERIIEWLDEDYDPDYFDPSTVKFDNPQKRLQKLS
ncbi:plasmid pRiA4b ORF-3 family protein [Selenihalanaerobacter shriftii]|nr:plasmid pRiA4b ORF-3 family protein [Selenihalanaerobacter shriftii]